MKTLALAVVALGLTACGTMTTQCVQPDPVEPASMADSNRCWNMGVDCGTPIDAVNKR